jgi:ERCC4-related helicase
MTSMDFVKHPLIREHAVESRLYQERIAHNVLEKGNTLVVMPTALGKTMLAVLVAAEVLKKKDSKVLIVAPTKPLATQHYNTMRSVLNLGGDEFALLTGSIRSAERRELWENARVISATPQTIENDLKRRKIVVDDVELLVVDESHHSVRSYSYVGLVRIYQEQAGRPLILGLTASPSTEKFREVCNNLFIKNIEVRTEEDEDVKPYIQQKNIEQVFVRLPPAYEKIRKHLLAYSESLLKKMRDSGFIHGSVFRKRELLDLQRRLIANKIYAGIVMATALIKAQHALEMLETQGVGQLNTYFDKLERNAKRTEKTMFNNPDFSKAVAMTRKMQGEGAEHPKLTRLKEIVAEELGDPKRRIIVFSHFRESAQQTTNQLNKVPGVRAVRFVGQASQGSDIGLNQKQQQEIIQSFRDGDYNVLVCTSVGEEGLDIPSVDLVIFYEPVPSEIRKIQREGRTGRRAAGRVIVLMARGTRDESNYWAAHYKQKRMIKTLRRMRSETTAPPAPHKGQRKLGDW